MFFYSRAFVANKLTCSKSKPLEAQPHRLALVADPQLVDPHTYPGRPWPLSSLTVRHTDMYLYRSYSRLQRFLQPNTIMFLGDLFDGGREWATRTTRSPEKRYKSYSELFWLGEYERFARIFFRDWRSGSPIGVEQRRTEKLPAQRILASLPGNHDLGIGLGIQLPVRSRFNAYFGDGNRVDVLGNHTICSVDAVSLTAYGQDDHNTGSQGHGLGDGPESREEKIWRPVMDFLDRARDLKARAVKRELALHRGERPGLSLSQNIRQLSGPSVVNKRELADEEDSNNSTVEFPTILLTHVPLFRPEGTPCGPQREHWPPTKIGNGQSGTLEKDERNAIAVRGGYQYQNVLTPDISKDLVEKIGNVGTVFSGDDHDYCEVVHKSYTSAENSNGGGAAAAGGIREITVKSISYAMGVRKPGFLMVSLWNPVDSHGHSTGAANKATLQTHLCLLPDQLGILSWYGIFVVLTLLLMLVRAIMVQTHGIEAFAASHSPADSEQPLLPITTAKPTTSWPNRSSAEKEKAGGQRAYPSYPSHSPHSSNSSLGSSSHAGSYTNAKGGLSVRSAAGRPRSTSPNGGYGIPASQLSSSAGGQAGLGIHFGERDEIGRGGGGGGGGIGGSGRREGAAGLWRRLEPEVRWSLWRVAWVSLGWYFWLAWRG
ncbi:MAG: hypothetical protein M1814_000313 [Vezdaea aestivalis]|nr:MAG: hypothetical protein M1814_000313 [Vezdaea aestivalis]